MGFLFLFMFGIGLRTPLLIIGTFSSSLSVLPKAGMWMVEVKKIFGFMLITMCFFYLSAILSWHIVLALFTCFLLATLTGEVVNGIIMDPVSQKRGGVFYFLQIDRGTQL